MNDLGKALRWIAAAVIALGIVCSAVNIANFSDRNLGLMIGIGFLVGGIQILVFGAIAPLLQQKSRELPVPETGREPA
jgi:hypothetical protein